MDALPQQHTKSPDCRLTAEASILTKYLLVVFLTTWEQTTHVDVE